MTRTPYLRDSLRLCLDHVLGTRALGLVLYGALPASLAGLGILKMEPITARRGLLVPMIGLGMIPTVLMYLLVRQRLTAWYVLRYGLWSRSAALTTIILALSSMMSGASGVIQGRYEFLPVDRWSPDRLWSPVFESVLTGAILLVGSTTLFITAVKEAGGLPALPPTDFVTDVKLLRDRLLDIKAASVWTTRKVDDKLLSSVKDAQLAAERLTRCSPHTSARRTFYSELRGDLEQFEAACKQVKGTPTKWDDLFECTPAKAPSHEKAMVKAVNGIRELNLNG